VNSTFFLSGGTWGQAMWAQGNNNSNIYYQAASQWIAAYLNVVAISELEGAGTFADVLNQYPQVKAAFDSGLLFFQTYTPGQTAGWRGNQQPLAAARAWRSVLASFNEGDIGPGHCDEDSSSAS
jgi:hypothetical protein